MNAYAKGRGGGETKGENHPHGYTHFAQGKRKERKTFFFLPPGDAQEAFSKASFIESMGGPRFLRCNKAENFEENDFFFFFILTPPPPNNRGRF